MSVRTGNTSPERTVSSLSADGFEKNERNYPAFYNTETQKTVVFDDLPGGGALSATSDGLGFTADSTFGPSSGKVVDIENGIVLGSALEWIESTYGIRIPSGYITYMPDSRDRFLGAMLFTGGPVVEALTGMSGRRDREQGGFFRNAGSFFIGYIGFQVTGRTLYASGPLFSCVRCVFPHAIRSAALLFEKFHRNCSNIYCCYNESCCVYLSKQEADSGCPLLPQTKRLPILHYII